MCSNDEALDNILIVKTAVSQCEVWMLFHCLYKNAEIPEIEKFSLQTVQSGSVEYFVQQLCNTAFTIYDPTFHRWSKH